MAIFLVVSLDVVYQTRSKLKHMAVMFFICWASVAQLFAQPLAKGWSSSLKGYWLVEQIDTVIMSPTAQLYVEINDKELLMVNGAAIKATAWKVDEEKRKLLLETEEGIEDWDIRYIDANVLEIFDPQVKTLMKFRRFEGPKETIPKAVTTNISDLIGNWLLVSVNDRVLEGANLELKFLTNGVLQLKNQIKTDNVPWRLNTTKTEVIIGTENTESWRITAVETNSISLFEKGAELRFKRSLAPITKDKTSLLYGKWTIVELGGTASLNRKKNKQIGLFEDGTLSFYTAATTTTKGSWKWKETKDGLYISTKSGEETWNILVLDEMTLLLDMGDLKMLLVKPS